MRSKPRQNEKKRDKREQPSLIKIPAKDCTNIAQTLQTHKRNLVSSLKAFSNSRHFPRQRQIPSQMSTDQTKLYSFVCNGTPQLLVARKVEQPHNLQKLKNTDTTISLTPNHGKEGLILLLDTLQNAQEVRMVTKLAEEAPLTSSNRRQPRVNQHGFQKSVRRSGYFKPNQTSASVPLYFQTCIDRIRNKVSIAYNVDLGYTQIHSVQLVTTPPGQGKSWQHDLYQPDAHAAPRPVFAINLGASVTFVFFDDKSSECIKVVVPKGAALVIASEHRRNFFQILPSKVETKIVYCRQVTSLYLPQHVWNTVSGKVLPNLKNRPEVGNPKPQAGHIPRKNNYHVPSREMSSRYEAATSPQQGRLVTVSSAKPNSVKITALNKVGKPLMVTKREITTKGLTTAMTMILTPFSYDDEVDFERSDTEVDDEHPWGVGEYSEGYSSQEL